MKEYIERAPLLERLSKVKMDEHGFGLAVQFGIDHASNCIKEAPAADVAPVVRCRECKKWDDDPDSYGKDDGPKGKCMKSFEETYDNDFCSYGQRKEATHD